MSKKISLFLILILILITAGCSTSSPNQAEIPGGQTNLPADSGLGQNGQNAQNGSNADPISGDSECFGDEIHPIGQSIAELYPEITDYTQVMTWFCAGFEFEDIITALETQVDTAIPAEELLSMFQNGKTWDDIWIELNLVDD